MLRRISTGWNFPRALQVVMGSAIAIGSGLDREWMGVIVGSYIGLMGLFAFGCASGVCFPTKQVRIDASETEYEKINER